MKSILTIGILAAGFVLSQAALAQGASPVTSQLLVHRVDMVAGKLVLSPAGEGKPGDVLQYSATYKNTAGTPAAKLLATLPVPSGTTLVQASAEPTRPWLPRMATHLHPCRWSARSSRLMAARAKSRCRWLNTARCAGTWAPCPPGSALSSVCACVLMPLWWRSPPSLDGGRGLVVASPFPHSPFLVVSRFPVVW